MSYRKVSASGFGRLPTETYRQVSDLLLQEHGNEEAQKLPLSQTQLGGWALKKAVFAMRKDLGRALLNN